MIAACGVLFKGISVPLNLFGWKKTAKEKAVQDLQDKNIMNEFLENHYTEFCEELDAIRSYGKTETAYNNYLKQKSKASENKYNGRIEI